MLEERFPLGLRASRYRVRAGSVDILAPLQRRSLDIVDALGALPLITGADRDHLGSGLGAPGR